MRETLTKDIHNALAEIKEIKEISLEYGVMNEAQREKVREIVRGGKAKVIPFARPDSLTRVIGVSSGKGGVGKSSLTTNLAIAVAKQGMRVGILDADVYGHSIPRLLGLIGQRPTAIDDMFIPLENHGVKCVSMEMFKPDRAEAVAYRGPILHKVLSQLLTDAFWGDLDFLFLDLPPGTGDLAISLGQLIPASELIVVTTPQIAAAEVAERSGRIAHQLKQQIIGVIENMSAFPCPNCGEKIELFGSGGGGATAERLSQLVGADVPVLGAIPFSQKLRNGGDDGAPVVISAESDPAAKAINEIAVNLTQRKRSLVGVPLKLNT
jgi:ATP-binding protein involved in chromosome partitioning